MSKVIKVENLSKAYQIGEFSTGTISRDLERWWALARGKEDPFLKIGETNVHSKKSESNVVWSLKDLNFEVEKGEAIGIIGKNGAGKSTLLKILSQVTTPTTGTIKMKGRVASLLEVGTGFHQELTGRENIYLNGAILGMQKAEVKKKFDQIVDFSGVERYIDTPVKRYSSGMYVRLAFAVAAHLDSEILIVDEVLAVGDAEFQNKCIGKMGDISKGEGRTILFVSHVLSMINNLCKNTIILEDGRIHNIGPSEKMIKTYLSYKKEATTTWEKVHQFDKYLIDHRLKLDFIEYDLEEGNGNEAGSISYKIHLINSSCETFYIKPLLSVLNEYEDRLYQVGISANQKNAIEITAGKNVISIQITNHLLDHGEYVFRLFLKEAKYGKIFDSNEYQMNFLVKNLLDFNASLINPPFNIKSENI